jgi:hypothetical protein
MTLTAKPFNNSQYIVLSDGRVARLLKPTKIHNQTYINLIIDKKMKRVNTTTLMQSLFPENAVRA